MDYADIIWSSCCSKSQNALQKIQNRGLRCIHNIPNSRPSFIMLEIYFTKLDGLIWQLGDDLICDVYIDL